MDNNILIKVENLTKKYKNKIVLEKINLEIKKGECIVLLGPNGSGKSTLLKILAEKIPYDSGNVKYFCENISYCPQENIFYEELTVYENLEYFGSIYGFEGRKLKEKVEEILKFVNLYEHKEKYPKELSGGMQRKLNIGIALINSGDLLILDEPTTGLDIISKYEIWELINKLKENNVGILLATHMMDEAIKLGDKICFIRRKIIDIDTFNNLKRRYDIKSIIEISTNKLISNVPEKFTRIDDFTLCYYSQEPEKDLPKVIEELIKNNLEISSIKVSYPSLEEIFVKIIGESHD